MEIDGKRIADFIGTLIEKDLKKKKKKFPPRLVTFLIGSSSDQLSYVKIKSNYAKKLGIKFELIHLKTTPNFERLAHSIKDTSQNPGTTGIIIQQPLPAQLSTDTVYDYISDIKEIEGHKRKTPYHSPIGLAVLTTLKYIFGDRKLNNNLLIHFEQDKKFFKKTLRNKKVVLIGRGITGGKPIGKTLTDAKINYIGINSTTPNPEEYIKEADIIITAVGKKVIDPAFLKQGVILINVGLHSEASQLKGDYNVKEIKNIASYYTPTPGGVGPIDIMYLYKNLIDAYKTQK